MKIGIIDVDSKIPNLALMKISAYHKEKSDQVEWFQPLFANSYDKVYASKIFTNSKNLGYVPKNAILGGSGYDLKLELPRQIEHIYPDYSLYPQMDYAMGYTTRGCINNCPFCIVRKKEGYLHRGSPLKEFWSNQEKIMLLDNCLTDHPSAKFILNQIRENNLRLKLCQGFNIRTMKKSMAKILSKIRLWKDGRWYIAWDNIHDEKKIFEGIELLNNAGIKNWKLMCYVLIGYNSTPKQDLYRINKLETLGIDAYAMPYVKNDYTNALAKWCNRKQLINSCSFEAYIKERTNYDQIKKVMDH